MGSLLTVRDAQTATVYQIEIRPRDNAYHTVGTRTSYNAGGLKPATHYTANVHAVGGPSASVGFTTPARPRPHGTEIPGGPAVFLK